jgi:YHS domain-containing protein
MAPLNMRAALTSLIMAVGLHLFAQGPVFSTREGAIRGFDPVAYFTEGKPVRGDSSITCQWQGATWRFSSAENRAAFEKEPEKFAPQFGGYCAFGVSRNYKVKTEPDAFTIVEGKLYLNYDRDVSVRWNANRTECIQKATENWKDLKDR